MINLDNENSFGKVVDLNSLAVKIKIDQDKEAELEDFILVYTDKPGRFAVYETVEFSLEFAIGRSYGVLYQRDGECRDVIKSEFPEVSVGACAFMWDGQEPIDHEVY